jgi:GT2 family glycosyltransferase
MYRFPPVENAIVALIRGNPRARYERWVADYDTLTEDDLAAMRDAASRLSGAPLFSVIAVLPEGVERICESLERSLREQVYDRWELKLVHGTTADHWGDTLSLCGGDYVVTVDAHTVLRPHALFLFARAISTNPDAVLLYADEDELDGEGRRSDHWFKPDWSPALLRGQNYLGGTVCFSRVAAEAAAGFRQEPDGDVCWGLWLRLTASAGPERVHHLPFLLSHHWDGAADHRPRGEVADGVRERLARLGHDVEVEPVGVASYRTTYRAPVDPPRASIVVPTTCRLDVLRPCVESILARTSYPRIELLLVVSARAQLSIEQQRFLEAIDNRANARVLRFEGEGPYNFAKTNNWAVGQTSSDIVCFLNDDTEAIDRKWLTALVTEALQDRVAASGALLLYPNGRIQHGGVILGGGGVAAHAYRGRPSANAGYHERALVPQDVSCVTAACMVVRREVFLDLGGFDEMLAGAFNDVDLCLRLRQAGWRIVWTPAAALYHKESASFGRHNLGERGTQWAADYALMQQRWREQLLGDPYYNPNLSLDGLELWEPASPPRVVYPWRYGGAARPTGW